MIDQTMMRAALQQARILADAETKRGNHKLASDWAESARYWAARLAAETARVPA